MMEQLFSGKVALVTGAGSGIGEATAKLYAAHGAKVIVSDLNEKGGNATVEAIRKNGGDAQFVKCDVGKPVECEQLVNAAIKAYGRLDIACNNAGIGGEQHLIADMSVEMKAGLVAKHPIGRLGKAEEVAELVIWLSSDKASFVTGAYYPVDGAYLAP